MDLNKVLQNYGLEEKEAKVYLALLKIGETTATRISEETDLDRTLMYQITNKLIEKGLVAYIIKNNVKYFSAADPEILIKNLKEKELDLKKALPNLKEIQKTIQKGIKIEIYRGRKGIKTIIDMNLREKKPYYFIGGVGEACKLFEVEFTIYCKRAEKLKMPGKILGRKEEELFISKNEEIRFLPEHMLSSTSQFIFGNKTIIFVWKKPYYAILIESDEIAKDNLLNFNYLWSIAEKPNVKEKEKRILP